MAPGQRSSRITGAFANGLRVDTASSSSSFESRTWNADPPSAFTCTLCSSSPVVCSAFIPVFADAITSLIRNPSTGISGSPSMLIATRAPLMVMLLMAMLRNTGVRSEAGSADLLISPDVS